MKAVILNCSTKASPEGASASGAARTLEIALCSLGVSCELAHLSDLWEPVETSKLSASGLPSPWLTEAVLQARILTLVCSPSSPGCRADSDAAIERLGSVLDRARGAGGKVAAPLSIERSTRGDAAFLHLCCHLMDVGYVVPEQAWRDWGRHPIATRTVGAAKDMVAVATALGAAVTGETISSYPPFAGPHPGQAGQIRRDPGIR